jgi:hypothetical protein
MSRYTLQARLVFLLVTLASLASVLGSEPWGPR